MRSLVTLIIGICVCVYISRTPATPNQPGPNQNSDYRGQISQVPVGSQPADLLPNKPLFVLDRKSVQGEGSSFVQVNKNQQVINEQTVDLKLNKPGHVMELALYIPKKANNERLLSAPFSVPASRLEKADYWQGAAVRSHSAAYIRAAKAS